MTGGSEGGREEDEEDEEVLLGRPGRPGGECDVGWYFELSSNFNSRNVELQ